MIEAPERWHALGPVGIERYDRPELEEPFDTVWGCDACDFWAELDDLRAVARHAVEHLEAE